MSEDVSLQKKQSELQATHVVIKQSALHAGYWTRLKLSSLLVHNDAQLNYTCVAMATAMETVLRLAQVFPPQSLL